MADIVEKRVFDDRTGGSRVYLASAHGVVRITVSDGRVGTFALVDDRRAVDVTIGPDSDSLVVATATDVLVGSHLAGTDFGAATAVAFDGRPLAAGPDGRLARLGDDGWEPLARLPAVRAIDDGLVATADGVYRLDGSYVGLDAVRDVAGAGPLAATAEGLYRLGNGWQAIRTGPFTVATSNGTQAHAATAESLLARRPDSWGPVDLPVEGPVVDVGYGESVYVATSDGQILASDDGWTDWRLTHLGVDGVTALAVE